MIVENLINLLTLHLISQGFLVPERAVEELLCR